MKNFAVLSLLFFLAIALTNCRSIPRNIESSSLEENALEETPQSPGAKELRKKKSKSKSYHQKNKQESLMTPEAEEAFASNKKLSKKAKNAKAVKEIENGDFSLYSQTDKADKKLLRKGKARKFGQMFASE